MRADDATRSQSAREPPGNASEDLTILGEVAVELYAHTDAALAMECLEQLAADMKDRDNPPPKFAPSAGPCCGGRSRSSPGIART
jgi:hypothetical protein